MATLFALFCGCALFLLFNLHVSAHPVFEDGYTVSTVLDGNKLKLNPHSVLSHFASSDLIVLDSEHNAFFTFSFSPSQESGIKKLSGHGNGFLDGDLATAMFNKPKSFAVDLSGNVYVADLGNLAIRKISKSGVTTIAGGSKIPGNADGPGRNASFSTDFELAFIPEKCSLMICDHGHKLVRQIYLKSEDCARGSHSALGMSTWAWALALGVSCLVGLIIGFAVRPYLTSLTGRRQPTFVQHDMEALPNPSGETTTDVLLRHEKHSDVLETKERTKSQMFAEQLKDLMTYDDEVVELPESADKILERGDNNGNRTAVLSEGHQRVDNMIYANIVRFEEQGKVAPVEGPLVSISGLVRRR